MADPLTTVAFGGLAWMAAGVAGNLTDRQLSGFVRGLWDGIAGWRGLPANHDVARAVRTAQIQALNQLIQAFRDTPRREWSATLLGTTPPDVFFAKSLAFCPRTLGLLGSVRLNSDATGPLGETIDVVLAPAMHDGPASDRAAVAARLAEDAVLEELRVEVDDKGGWPEGFEEHFRDGNGGNPRFLDLFGAYIAEQIKRNKPLESILNAVQRAQHGHELFTVAALLERFGSVLTDLKPKLDHIAETQDHIAQT